MITSVDCPTVDALSALAEGTATADAAEGIRAHLDCCVTCRQLLADSLRSQPNPAASQLTTWPQTLTVGETVNGRFRIDRFIARGGMGEVYQAWDLLLNETVALKTIVCTGLDDGRLLARLRAEVQLARKVSHPNVCRIMEFGHHHREYRKQWETIPFLTMEFLGGETLAARVRARGPMKVADILPIARQIVDGLQAVHDAQIVHRDLKPENVFLLPKADGAWRVVVMDFGLARSTVANSSESRSSQGSVLGTIEYMAPEQCLGGLPSRSWDIYALGVMLFEMAAGRSPFDGKTAIATLFARTNGVAPPLDEYAPGVHPSFARLVAWCLQTEPARRCPDMGAILKVLEQIALAPPPRRPGWKFRAGLFGAVTLAAAVAGTLALSRPPAPWPLLPAPPSTPVLYRAEFGAGHPENFHRSVADEAMTVQETGNQPEPAMIRAQKLRRTPRSDRANHPTLTALPASRPVPSRAPTSKTSSPVVDDDEGLAIPSFAR